MKKELITELKGLKKELESMPKSKKRDLLFLDYYKYISFLRDLGIIKGDNSRILEFNGDDDLINEKIELQSLYEIQELLENSSKINEKIEEIISVYHDNNYYSVNNFKMMKINNKNIGKILNDFFASIDSNILKIYNQLIEEEHIYFGTLYDAGGETCFSSFDKLSNIIINGNGDNLYDYISLVHEVGHAYQKYLERNNTNIHGIHYGVEITSMLIEKLFIKYLEDNYLFNEQVNLINTWELSSNLNTLSHCKLIGNLVNEGNINIDFINLDVYSDLSDDEVTSLLEEDCGYVFDDRKKLNLINYTYVIGDIMSSYFYYKINDNKEKGVKELKNFIVSIYDMPLDEFIEKYMNDIEAVKRYVNEKINDKNKKLKKNIKK